MSRVLPAAALGLYMACGGASASASDVRLKVVDYEASKVLQLTAFVGYHVHFEFAPDEHFVNLGAGDTASIDVGAEGNHLLLKPRAASSGTNITIITNRRVYFVDYRAIARSPRTDEAVYSIAYRYPTTVQSSTTTSDREATARLDELPAAKNRDYWYSGDRDLRPLSAVDDGLQIHLRFPAHAELPTIYVVAADGSESLVNTHVEADTVVVHRIAPRLVLRRGSAAGCVVDRNQRATVRRAVSGTLDPSTRREVVKELP
jgi:type IV secretion system protein VirB9